MVPALNLQIYSIIELTIFLQLVLLIYHNKELYGLFLPLRHFYSKQI